MTEPHITIAIVACAGFACVSSVVWMFTRDTGSYIIHDHEAEPDDDGEEWKKGKRF
jgi:hypothetical protein